MDYYIIEHSAKTVMEKVDEIIREFVPEYAKKGIYQPELYHWQSGYYNYFGISAS